MINKKWLGGVAGIGVVAATFGFAATLNIGPADNLAAGTEAVTSCQTADLDISWTTSYDATTGQYEVDTVHVAAIDPECSTAAYSITLAASDNSSLFEGTGTVVAATEDVAVGVSVSAEAVADVHVIFDGGDSANTAWV